ncbi:hypothetical protein FJ420_30585 [Mesorhizobium sp. B3-1-3]|uniref:hypothetical protein n=1 Tax=unclassified Mesorhizobium TaxID=325217 RepID=UPI00112D4058|nr:MULTISPECIES: hypothetical protein [unclassified Mesorhizobium]TPI54213.1 hypothetical protein FJ424_31465 [Mesorhizobium sp. B3-1-8]TPI61425.1 hypothetical protein FJ420_30585 [Mesorhizobium sp. B3-1-3]
MSLALTLALAATPAFAQEKLSLDVAVPVVNVPSELFAPNGKAADFLGIGLGQTVEDIRKILAGQNFSNENPSGRFLLDEEYYTVEIVASGPNRYFSDVIWSGPEDVSVSQSFRVEFSSPLTGQRSRDVRRFVTYKGGRGPLLATLRSAILQKYGPPSADRQSGLVWFWDHGRLVKSNAGDKQMLIGIKTNGDYVQEVTYALVDDAGWRADTDQIEQFQKSVEDRAKQMRDSHATAPKL